MDVLRNSSAIVLGGEVNGLAVIRSLGRLGVRVAAIRACKPGDPAAYSRYTAFTGEISADATDEALLLAISGCAARIGGHPIVLVPTTDRFSELLAAHDPALRPHFVVCNPQAAVCTAFLDKWSTAEL
jgi:predicted ATP-grasp superfamily ATP-dependent carboligase